jgi:excisionase family DNA binding protein
VSALESATELEGSAHLPISAKPLSDAVHTIAEVASILKIGRKKTERLVRSGELRAKWIGRSARITRITLEAFLADPAPADGVMMPLATRRALKR